MKDNKYVILLIALLVLYVFYEMQKPQEENWTASYSYVDQNPFGAKALYELSPSLFKGKEIQSSFETLYELYEVSDSTNNILVVADQLSFDKDESELLLQLVKEGRTVLLAAQSMEGELADTLSIKMREQAAFFSYNPKAISESLAGENVETITYEDQMIEYPFLGALASFDRVGDEFEVLAENSIKRPVLLSYRLGKGRLVLSSMPLAFTNYFTLLPETYHLTQEMMKLFPEDQPPVHIEYYQLGRLESGSPIRVLLSNPSLRMATYLVMFVLLIFLIFQAKRRQRIIPILEENPNMSLEFVQTLGSLYYRQSNHLNLMKKRVLYWKEYVRSRYHLNTEYLNDDFLDELGKKSGYSSGKIVLLRELILAVEQGGRSVDDRLLKDLENRLNEFYGIS